VFGPEASGKTTLALHAIAEVHKLGQAAAFIDAEHAFDVNYARALGVNVDELLFAQPDSGEQALDITERLVESGDVQIIVVDSVAALTPKSELEGEMGAPTMGAHARLMSQALRKLVASVSRKGVILYFINQIRSKIGVIFGSPEVTTGGNALKFYASMRLDIRRRAQVKQGEGAIGNQVHIKVVKNKLAPPFKEVELDLIWGRGIDKVGDMIAVAVELAVIVKAGAHYTYDGVKISHGYNALVAELVNDHKLFAELSAKTRALAFTKPTK
jgi:recombination protein RecA